MSRIRLATVRTMPVRSAARNRLGRRGSGGAAGASGRPLASGRSLSSARPLRHGRKRAPASTTSSPATRERPGGPRLEDAQSGGMAAVRCAKGPGTRLGPACHVFGLAIGGRPPAVGAVMSRMGLVGLADRLPRPVCRRVAGDPARAALPAPACHSSGWWLPSVSVGADWSKRTTAAAHTASCPVAGRRSPRLSGSHSAPRHGADRHVTDRVGRRQAALEADLWSARRHPSARWQTQAIL